VVERTTVVFAGGGTGGHLFPGIAVAEELLCRDPNTHIVFAGSERDVEREIIARQGYEHFALPVVPSSSWKQNPFGFVWKNWAAVRQARRFLSREGSAMIVGLGGFASVPVVWAASSLGLRIALLEQNLVPGRATRWLARRAHLICTSFSDTTSRLGNSPKVRITGNPVRRSIADLHKTSVHADGATLLVLGGSQGSSE
jgi:UDP-N-acetylglucosamine--N-acetylmuramyl-(pentapeptide) pyrophosphoryl-undecaprenol N-acetylglucosamine transferase